VSAASSDATSTISPGNIIAFLGINLGPDTLVQSPISPDGRLPTRLSDTRVLIDGIEAPLLYVWYWQTSAIVPQAVSERSSVLVQVEYRGVQSDNVYYPVRTTAPALFTLDMSGGGPSVVLNQDGSLNSPTNPAAPGSVVALWATGTGETYPPIVDGQPAIGVPPKPIAPLSVLIGGLYAEIIDVNAAAVVPGLMQLSVRIPPEVQGQAEMPVVLIAGGASSQPTVTIFVGNK
jgi:uncharacterized protein (TIGR03437 family)